MHKLDFAGLDLALGRKLEDLFSHVSPKISWTARLSLFLAHF